LRSIPVISAILLALTGAPNSRMACNTFSFMGMTPLLSPEGEDRYRGVGLWLIRKAPSLGRAGDGSLQLQQQPVLRADLFDKLHCTLAPVEVFLLVLQVVLQQVVGGGIVLHAFHALH